jgi:hypothetical protein
MFRRETLGSIPEENKSVDLCSKSATSMLTKSTILLDKIHKEKIQRQDTPKKIEEFKSIPKQNWMQNSDNFGGFFPYTASHSVKYQYMVQKMAMQTIGKGQFKGYTYQYAPEERMEMNGSMNETEVYRNMHHPVNYNTKETNEVIYIIDLIGPNELICFKR